MILAAGRGHRLRPLTDRVPKPLIEVGGETLLARHLRRLSGAGVQRVVINTAWLGKQIRAAVGDGGEFGVRIDYSDEGQEALETGGGIARALPMLGASPFLLVNGDIWTDCDFGALDTPGTRDLGNLLLVDNPPNHRDGDFGLAGDRVVARPCGGCGSALTYAGVAVLRPELFAGCPEGAFPLAPLFHAALSQRRLRGQYFGGAWFDTGTIENLARARAYATAALGR